jgi:hypothetical protein
MKLDKANKRDKKIQKKKSGMRVSGKSVFLLQEIVNKKAEEARNESNS